MRLSIRSLPDEHPRPDGDILHARGIWHGDTLPPIDLGSELIPAVTLDLGYMRLGEDTERGPSWLARTLALREKFGPFKLAWLETLLRAADARASAAASNAALQP